MPTIHCKRTDCQHIGKYEFICIKRNIDMDEDGCHSYESIAGLMHNKSPNCHKDKGGKYTSSRVKLVR